MTTWANVVAVAVGGALGGIARYLAGLWFIQRFGPGFPFGTLFVNISGSFLIGVVVELSVTRSFGMTPFLRLLLATGFLGGYTTFSSFTYETFTLGSEGFRVLSLAYACGSVVLGLAAFFAGSVCARLVSRV